MVISSGGGFILDFALSGNPGVAVFSPVINGVGGNLVAVFSSRISTYLHLNHEKTQLPTEFGTGCVQPCFLLCSPGKILSNESGNKTVPTIFDQLKFDALKWA